MDRVFKVKYLNKRGRRCAEKERSVMTAGETTKKGKFFRRFLSSARKKRVKERGGKSNNKNAKCCNFCLADNKNGVVCCFLFLRDKTSSPCANWRKTKIVVQVCAVIFSMSEWPVNFAVGPLIFRW